MGIEGQNMQNNYRDLAYKYNIQWNGRTYHTNDFSQQDNINKAITSANQLLYAVIASVINALGYSTAIGFVHTGKMMSFVYDIADLYKERIILPEVFRYTSEYKGLAIERDIKAFIYKIIIQQRLVDSVIKDVESLF